MASATKLYLPGLRSNATQSLGGWGYLFDLYRAQKWEACVAKKRRQASVYVSKPDSKKNKKRMVRHGFGRNRGDVA